MAMFFCQSCGLANVWFGCCQLLNVPKPHVAPWVLDLTFLLWCLYCGKCRFFLYHLSIVELHKEKRFRGGEGKEPRNPI